MLRQLIALDVGINRFLLSKVKLSTSPVNVDVDMLLCSSPGLHSYISYLIS